MRKSRFLGFFLTLLAISLVTSCSEFRKLQKSTDWEKKYKAAIKYYDEEDYYKASVLLDQILPIIKGTTDGERASFLRAYSYYHQQQFILSAEYFKEFTRVYSRSEYALEAAYLSAHSLYMQSPDYNLDQRATVEAMEAFQNFLNRNPNSEYAPKTSAMIDELQRKLEKKGFENAKLYYKLRKWKPARVAFETFEDEFPDSKLIEEVKFMAMDAEYQYAEQSIRTKQKERYQKTIELYEAFVDRYPESELLKEAEERYAKSLEQIEKL
ncbi:outer membrane protein assembly factor BamD [Reichenbachiella versicolor]|uniref:outer membrane protein assembly factor BamD n=1 Tax=Reichenbachiella versicolor TaxID=1821036 RepID=UPI000D6E9393|nr:outer membrane protein assembly factor BamD [Reichenbachiella versicolor]